MTRARLFQNQVGMSLIETLAAIVVFGLMTVGVTPLIASSLRGSALSRSFTVAKNLGQEAMERLRGFPYFDTAPNRDVLDLYFPNLQTPGYSAATQTFTTVCTPTTATPAASGARACPPDLPDGTAKIPTGYTVTFVARFVTPSGTSPETYSTAMPPSGYDANTPATATPPTLTEITVTVSWEQLGRPRNFSLTSLLGERKLSPNKVGARASIDYVAQVLTSYQEASGRTSTLKAVAGRSASDVEIRSFAAANQDTSAGLLTLSFDEFGLDPGTIFPGDDVSGAQATLHAPPTTSPAPQVTSGSKTVTHDGFFPVLDVGHIGTSAVHETSPTSGVSVITELPKASGNFALTTGAGLESFWVVNQADTSEAAGLQLLPGAHPFFVRRPLGGDRLIGDTYAEATAVSPTASRKVHATASADSSPMHLLPTTFAPNGVVRISNFRMDVECKATGSAATTVATGDWSATLEYWTDPTNDGSVLDAGYVSVANIGGSWNNPPGTADPLATINVNSNPLVFDAIGVGDTYLFDDPTNGRAGYLESWSTSPVVSAIKVEGRSARVDLGSAISISTAQTNPINPETRLSIAIGRATCLAEDNR